MKYILFGKKIYGDKPFPISLNKITSIRSGTFGVFDNYPNVLVALYTDTNSYGDVVEKHEIIGHYKYSKAIFGWFFFSKNPIGLIYNFNSEFCQEDIQQLLNIGI